jgi:hypothetical protein
MLISISVHLFSIFCAVIVSLYNFLCSSKVFSSFSVTCFPDCYNLSFSFSPVFLVRCFLFCSFIFLSLFILFHSSIFLLYLYFSLSFQPYFAL